MQFPPRNAGSRRILLPQRAGIQEPAVPGWQGLQVPGRLRQYSPLGFTNDNCRSLETTRRELQSSSATCSRNRASAMEGVRRVLSRQLRPRAIQVIDRSCSVAAPNAPQWLTLQPPGVPRRASALASSWLRRADEPGENNLCRHYPGTRRGGREGVGQGNLAFS